MYAGIIIIFGYQIIIIIMCLSLARLSAFYFLSIWRTWKKRESLDNSRRASYLFWLPAVSAATL